MKFGLSENVYSDIKKVVEKFSEYKIKIFGSRARGDYKYNSDIDIAIYGDIDDENEFKIRNEFDLLCIPYTMDIVFVNKIQKEKFLSAIEKEGVEF